MRRPTGRKSAENHLEELSNAAERAGAIVTEHIDLISQGAEGEAANSPEAERTRRDAIDSARRLLEHVHALEPSLAELVRQLQAEVDRVAELEESEAVDVETTGKRRKPRPRPKRRRRATAATKAAVKSDASDDDESEVDPAAGEPEEPEPSRPAESQETLTAADEGAAENDALHDDGEQLQTVEPPEAEPTGSEPTDEPEPPDVETTPRKRQKPRRRRRATAATKAAVKGDASHDDEEQLQTVEPTEAEPTGSEAAAAATSPRRGLFSRLRRSRKRPFVGHEGHCAVCRRAFMAGSVESLESSGWLVNREIGVCPDCQSDGWQLPDGASLPLRRRGG